MLFSKQIPVKDALKIAHSLEDKTSNLRSTYQPVLVKTIKSKSTLRTSVKPSNLYYIFNRGNNNGYVIVAADDLCPPILGYTENGNYDENNLPPNYSVWMANMESAIQATLESIIEPKREIKEQWDNYLNENAQKKNTVSSWVNPLIATQWDQRSPYWNSIPFTTEINGNLVHPFTGCVATALAQILKYHEYPRKPQMPTLPYTTMFIPRFNIPSVPAYEFDWKNMYAKYSTTGNALITEVAVARLMYFCGASLQMNYSYENSLVGSDMIIPVLKRYFGYDAEGIYYKQNYSNETWINMIKENLNKGLPIYYSGNGNRGGHAFICDGYDPNGLFHFNWGWSGNHDGYFSIDDLYDFNNWQSMVYNIIPKLEPEDIYITCRPFNNTIDIDIKKYGLPAVYGGLYTDHKWYLADDWNQLKDAFNNIESNPIPYGTYNNYLYSAKILDNVYYLNKEERQKASYRWTQLSSSTYRLLVNFSPRPNDATEIVIPLQLIFSRRYGGDPVIYKLVIKYKHFGSAASYARWYYYIPDGVNDNLPVWSSLGSFRSASEEMVVPIEKEDYNNNSDIKIYNLSGQLVKTRKNVDHYFNINSTSLSNGVYIIEKIDKKGNRTTEKVILKR